MRETGLSFMGESRRRTSSTLPMIALALAGSLWGTAFLFGKIALREMSVAQDVAFRFGLGSLLLSPALFAIERQARLSLKDWGLVVIAAVIRVPVQFVFNLRGCL